MYQFENDPPAQERVAETLVEADESLAVAESLTGGLVGVLLTGVVGAGGFFHRSLVTYTYEAKREELGVDRSVLEDIGAVNAVVAEQMARGVREAAGTTWGLATTGLAGPPDAAHAAPVGTVYIGVVRGATDDSEATAAAVERYEFDGSRSEIQEQAARQALRDLANRALLHEPDVVSG